MPESWAPVSPPVSVPAKSGAIPPPASTETVTDKDPKLQVYELAAKRVSMETTYGPLLSRLQLTPAERERFLDVMLGRHEVTNDTANAVRSLGVKDSPAIQQLLQQQKDETSKAQLALLGEARLSELQQYERSRVVRAQVVDRLGGAMATTETPLTASQAEQLTQVLAGASSSYRSGGTATADSINWDTAVADAKAVLAGPQLEAFARHAARQKTFYRVKQFILAAKPVVP